MPYPRRVWGFPLSAWGIGLVPVPTREVLVMSNSCTERQNLHERSADSIAMMSQRLWGEIVKLLALTFLIIGNLAASHAYAYDVSPQPLTRIDCHKAALTWDANANVCVANQGNVAGQPLTRLDCDKAGMAWDVNANKCGTGSQEAETPNTYQAADNSSQPLTRKACDAARMIWNDQANVCGEKSGGTHSASKGTNPIASTILITIDKTKQKMTVSIDGVEKYDWPVSTGRPRYATPSGTYTAISMNEVWYSKEWDNAPMPHSIFFMKDGHAIHGSYEVKTLGKPVSHGCVRIAPKNAVTLYALVKENGLEKTEVVLIGLTPGGESKVESGPSRTAKGESKVASGPSRTPKGKSKVVSWAGPGSRYAEAGNGWYRRGDQPQRRRGFFARLFGGRH